MTIEPRVYQGASPGTLRVSLDESRHRGWTDQLNDVGEGHLELLASDTDLGSLDFDDIIRMRLDGTDRFAWLVENKRRSTIHPSEEAGQTIVISGRGVLALLEDSPVYPERGVPSRLNPQQRLFNWTSQDFDDSAWPSAFEVKQQGSDIGSAELLPGQWAAAPVGFPVTTAWWIWSQDQDDDTSPPQPVGYSLFRQTFTLAQESGVRIFINADDGFEIYIDGVLIASETRAFMWQEVLEVDPPLHLDAGTHQVAIKAINIDRPSNDATNVAGVIAAAYSTTNGGELSALLWVTDETWLTLGYPSEAPGMTPGQILDIALTEAQDRGELAGVTWDFDAADDSDGTPWDHLVDLQVDVGATSILDLARKLIETSIDIRMTPSLVLQAFNRGALGTDRTATVELTRGVLGELAHDGKTSIASDLLVRDAAGVLLEVASGAGGRRKVKYLSLAGAGGTQQAARVADAYLETGSVALALASGAMRDVGGATQPYADWQPGDTVSVLADDGSSLGDARVRTLQAAEIPVDSDGAVGGTVTFRFDAPMAVT